MAARPVAAQASGAPEFVNETDLALKRFGAKVVFATDEWFAVADNLLNHEPPVFIADKYTEYGKWMDGWESRRKRVEGHDWCIIKLAFPGRILGVDVDTSFFTGNHVPRCSIQAATLDDEPEAARKLMADRDDPRAHSGKMGTKASDEEVALAESLGSDRWKTIVEFHPLEPGYVDSCHNYFQVKDDARYTHIRLNMFPDGGIARLRVYGEVVPNWGRVPVSEVVDLAAVQNGGKAVGCSDMHFGHPKNLINPGRGINMGDGWETARKLSRPPIFEKDEKGLIKLPGDDWAVLKLGAPGVIQQLEVDTCHFKGNYPESCMLEAAQLPEGTTSRALLDMQAAGRVDWQVLLPRTKLGPDRQVWFEVGRGGLNRLGPVSHLKLTIYPDGGISRIRALGTRHVGSHL